MDWTRSSITHFIRGPGLHTPEGWAFLGGSLLSLLFGALAWLIPDAVLPNPATGPGAALLFSIWPLAVFTVYMMFCAPSFQPTLFTTVLMLCAAAFPFWAVYVG